MADVEYAFPQTVFRLRDGVVIDPYSGEETGADPDTPTVLAIVGGFVQQTSTSMLASATREQALEAKSLFCEGDVDVQKGDRILVGTFTPSLPAGATTIPPGTVFVGAVYTIDGIPPAADSNPFTAWTPPREIPLTRSVG